MDINNEFRSSSAISKINSRETTTQPYNRREGSLLEAYVTLSSEVNNIKRTSEEQNKEIFIIKTTISSAESFNKNVNRLMIATIFGYFVLVIGCLAAFAGVASLYGISGQIPQFANNIITGMSFLTVAGFIISMWLMTKYGYEVQTMKSDVQKLQTDMAFETSERKRLTR